MNAYLSIAEICERTGFSRSFVAREMKRGNLQFSRIGRRVRVSASWFHNWMRGLHSPEPTSEEWEATNPTPPDPMANLQSRVDEIANVLTGIASRMEERGKVLEGIGSNLDSLVTEIRSRRVKPGQVR